MITTLLLIRHATTQSNINHVYLGFSEEDINEEGLKQLENLAIRLKQTRIDTIYSSPLKRTYTVAKRIARERNLDCIVIDDLREIDFGEWEGLSKVKIQQKWPELWGQLMCDPGQITLPNGESFRATMDRAISAFEEIVQNNPNKCVAIITHDIIIKMIVMHVLQSPTSSYHNFQIDCSSLSKIIAQDGVEKLVYLNDTTHVRSY